MSAITADPEPQVGPLTLGDLLYANPGLACVTERDWQALVYNIAAGDQAALRALFEKTYALVFTYLLRVTGDREVAEHLTVDVFEDIWCEAPVFDSAAESVLGWLMNRARASALARASRPKHEPSVSNQGIGRVLSGPAESSGIGHERDQLKMQSVLDDLTMPEREAIEAILNGASYAQVAEQAQESATTIRSRVRSGLAKLRVAAQNSIGGAA